ncbi:hypothetical protein [Actinomadura atramentaria]|uniref:ferredoxin reductase family protein n=1 Tax=Actinomadura atramentaria TaxID=1990 RepID=UPI0003A95922|nr:hypothetical protein [Actinomadura atramentaria]
MSDHVETRTSGRRLPYEVWHALHLGVYVALFLALFHQLANGAQFAASPLARTFWYVLYLGAAALVLWFRVLTPVFQARRHRMRVAAVVPEAPGVWSVHVTGRRLDRLGAEPGQFLRWRFAAPGLWWAANPYSLSAPPLPDRLRITVKAAGGHSAALARLRPGTRVFTEGPSGALTGRSGAPRSLLLAGGVGITPLRTLFETLPGDVVLIYTARREQDLALRAELDAVAAARGARVLYFTDDPVSHRLDLGSLRRLVPDVAAREVYLCGPPGLTAAARTALRAAGVPRGRVHAESFEL